MSKIWLSTAAACALVIAGVATPACARDVYGDYGQGQYDRDARYQRGGQGGYRACQDREIVGTGFGAIIGGVLGNQFGRGSGRAAATIGGVILGGIAGNAIARDGCRNERADAYYYNRAYYEGFEEPRYGRRYRWRNPYTGHHGFMQPIRDYDEGYRHGYDDECREFRQTIFIDGRRTTGYGTACRNPDGTWAIVGR